MMSRILCLMTIYSALVKMSTVNDETHLEISLDMDSDQAKKLMDALFNILNYRIVRKYREVIGNIKNII